MAQLLLVNPRRRKRRKNPVAKKRRRTVKRRRNPVSIRSVSRQNNPRRRRKSSTKMRRRRNPIGGLRRGNFVNTMLKPALTGAVGAIGLDVFFGYATFIPAELTTGMQKHLVKAIAAVGLGVVASKVIKKKTAEEMAVGAMTVVLHDALRDVIAKSEVPVKLGYYMDSNNQSSMGYYNPGYVAPALSYYPQNNAQPGLNDYWSQSETVNAWG